MACALESVLRKTIIDTLLEICTRTSSYLIWIKKHTRLPLGEYGVTHFWTYIYIYIYTHTRIPIWFDQKHTRSPLCEYGVTHLDKLLSDLIKSTPGYLLANMVLSSSRTPFSFCWSSFRIPAASASNCNKCNHTTQLAISKNKIAQFSWPISRNITHNLAGQFHTKSHTIQLASFTQNHTQFSWPISHITHNSAGQFHAISHTIQLANFTHHTQFSWPISHNITHNSAGHFHTSHTIQLAISRIRQKHTLYRRPTGNHENSPLRLTTGKYLHKA